MVAKVIAVAQRKGGAGKTTMAAQLGIAWAAAGRKVALLDVDPQGSLAAWSAAREKSGLKSPIAVAVQGWRLSGEIDRLKNAYDLVIIDTPPHADFDARVACRAAELILVPVQPSPMDLWATGPTLDLARQEKGAALLVLNRLPARGKLVDMARARIAAEKLPLANATLGNRSAFAASMMAGRGVAETHAKSLAAREIAALAEEIASRLKL